MACNTKDMVQKILDDAVVQEEKVMGASVSNVALLEKAIPEKMWDILFRMHLCSGAPMDYYVLAAITATSLAVGNRLYVEMNETWHEYCGIFAALVGKTGDCKSFPIDQVFKFFDDIDEVNAKSYEMQMDDFEKRQAEAIKSQDSSFTEKPPVWKQNIIRNTTYEALSDALKANPHGISEISDELTSFLQSLKPGRNKSHDMDLNSLFNGKCITENRRSRRGLYIPKPFFSFIGTIQIGLLNKLTEDEKGKNGFFDRILFAYPKTGKRNRWKDNKKTDIGASVELKEIFKKIRERASRLCDAKARLTFSKESDELLSKWQDRHADKIDNTDNDLLRGSYCKQENYILRFCLILHEIDVAISGVESEVIRPDIVKRAIAMSEYFQRTAEKVVTYLETSPRDDTEKIVYDALPDKFKKGDGDKIAADVAGWDSKRLYRFLKRTNNTLFRNVEYSYYEKVIPSNRDS